MKSPRAPADPHCLFGTIADFRLGEMGGLRGGTRSLNR